MAYDVLRLFYAIASGFFFFVLAKLLQFGCTPTEDRVKRESHIRCDDFAQNLPHDNSVREDIPNEEIAALRRDKLGGSLSKSCLSLNEAPELEEYELVKVIGRGSYSTVFMVEKKETRELFAMKVMSKLRITRQRELHCIVTEQRVLQLGLSCDFLVGLHAAFESNKRFYFVIEIARGGDLMYHLQCMGRLEEEHARFYAAEICLALNFLHCNGIIYRDLKLDNVLLDHLGHIKLTDFGICKEGIDRENQFAKTLCGTPNYVSPEMLRGQGYGFSVDWWALGVLLYEMLVGSSPFNGSASTGDLDAPLWDGGDLIHEILCKEIIIPPFISGKANHILKALLRRSPRERLGCQSGTAFADICAHPFFESIDWDQLAQKLITPPYKPRLSANRDSRCFDPHFTSEPVELPEDEADFPDGAGSFGSFSSFDYEASLSNTENLSDQD